MQIDVAVVGSLNLDDIIQVDRMPDVGETVLGDTLTHRPGGKGANQSVAAAAIAPTAMVGAVGDDDAGTQLRSEQTAHGVDVSWLRTVPGISGRAIIEVDTDGNNRIVVLSGANAVVDDDYTRDALDALTPQVVLTQLESPRMVTAAVADWARAKQARFVLNPSPVAPLDDDILSTADPLVVNEIEAAYYARDTDPADTDDPQALARRLLDVSRSVVVTLGGDGVVVATRTGDQIHITPIEVEPVVAIDTTGAGDLFVGRLAALLARGTDTVAAARDAAAAATRYVATARN